MGNDADNTTKSTRKRWEWTGTVGAFVLLVTMCAVVLVYVERGRSVPVWASAAFSISVLAAAAWTFGESALKAARSSGGDE